MNHVFKTTWNVARQVYTVTDEHHASQGKATKSALTVLASALLLAGVAQAAYVEPGFVAQDASQVKEAVKSWETVEYQKDWGLAAMHASSAYALGFHGQNTAVAVMDSGALLQKHPELAGSRFHASHASGKYGSSGNRYQVDVPGIGDDFGNGGYKEGEAFDIDGNFIGHLNDTHGTHVTGTVGANRDGSEFHGVAWGSQIWAANSGGTDNTNYGPFQDHDYFYTVWKAVADDLVAANGEKRGGVINNSFGTNLRFTEKSTSKVPNSFATDTTAQTEHEYFLFKKKYGDKPNFVDGAWEAVRGTHIVQVFTTGNRNFNNPYYRPLYPYFNPESEQNWIAVAGLMQDVKDPSKYIWVDRFNEAGNSKWWTVVAPGSKIYSSIVYDDHYEDTDGAHPLGSPGYASYGGTSMAAPHVTGAMGVLMSRYQDMSAIQARTVLLTTANHKNTDGSNFEGWTAAEGTPDIRYGWGVPDLEKGMYGPAQFLEKFEYSMDNTPLDVWTNAISQVALDARKAEDDAWMQLTENGTNLDAEPYELGTGKVFPTYGDASVSQEDAKKWRKEYYDKRVAAIQARDYNGSLVKDGKGKLVLTGDNTYRGGTTVKAGTLLGFIESFGIADTDNANGKVVVEGGSFGLLNKYQDRFTMRGNLQHSDKASHNVDVDLKSGSTLIVAAGQDVKMGKLTIAQGAKYTVSTEDMDVLEAAYKGEAQTGSVTASELTVEGAATAGTSRDAGAAEIPLEKAESPLGSPFFKYGLSAQGNTITGTLTRDTSKSLTDFATNANELAVASALDQMADGKVFDALLLADSKDITSTYASLSDDFLSSARNANIINGLTLSRAVKDQINGIGEGRKTKMLDGHGRIWATGVGSWSKLDRSNGDADSDFYAGAIGVDADVTDNTKLGVFFGAGTTKTKAGVSKVESDDIHVGLYGLSTIGDVASISYGAIYSHLLEDVTRQFQVGSQVGVSQSSGSANQTQVFVEGAYTGLNTTAYSVEPYVGISFIHATAGNAHNKVGLAEITSATESRDIAVGTLGVRGAVPFATLGAAQLSLKGDLSWNRFFGDTKADTVLSFGGTSVAKLEGEKLENLFNVGLGVEAQFGQVATAGLSYTGSYNSNVKSHGVMANIRFLF